MLTTFRAGVSVLMLLGFYVLALGIVGGLGYASYWLWQEHAGSGAAKLSYVTIAVTAGIVVALWRVIRAKPGEPDGVRLAPEQAPELWTTVRELAAEAKTRAPDELMITPDVNAAVSEDSKLLGFVGGRRHLYLGLPLLQALSVAQMRSVLAHELGHYSNSHTRLECGGLPRPPGDDRHVTAVGRSALRLAVPDVHPAVPARRGGREPAAGAGGGPGVGTRGRAARWRRAHCVSCR